MKKSNITLISYSCGRFIVLHKMGAVKIENSPSCALLRGVASLIGYKTIVNS